MLPFVKARPLTLIRFPDGIDKGHFYTKTKPEWTPNWIGGQLIQHSEEAIEYIVIKEKPGLVWLANLAALELHPMQMTVDNMDLPDHFIFDLDPPEGTDFEGVKSIAFRLRDFLESQGYIPFIKTSGSKGLHIFVPIIKEHDHEKMVEQVKVLASSFVKQNKEDCTLAMSKEKRKGKTLIDIFRNHKAHTTVAPYSMRGKTGSPISFPITWSELNEVFTSKDIHIRNYQDWLDKRGDAWANFYESARPLIPEAPDPETQAAVDKKLKSYYDKRDMDATPEPGGAIHTATGDQCCIQLHDAQNLHYDLRLEADGVLLSWAIPKGLPFKKGVKRLAIRTEDHPLQYLDFEGVIPKGQYGAGQMWVFARGRFKWDSKKDKSLSFTLDTPEIKRSYKIYNTKEDQWIIELASTSEALDLHMPLEPMLAGVSETLPALSKYTFEIKWDGIRSLIHLDGDSVKIYSRSGRDISKQFPELCDPDLFDVEQGVFDGEIVVLDEQGRPVFSQVISRMHSAGKTIQTNKKKYPVVCYLFDALLIDGVWITDKPLIKRQAWLSVCLKKQGTYRISETMDDGKGLFEAARAMNLEGVMAKDKLGKYILGQRRNEWLKIKFRHDIICTIAGYTRGEGDRSGLFGSLHLLAAQDDGTMKYMGRVGTGFDTPKMKKLLTLFEPLVIDKKSFSDKVEEAARSIWLEPILQCEVKYASLSSNGTLREPVFQKLIEKN